LGHPEEFMNNLLTIIDNKKAQLDKTRPLPSALVQNLKQWFAIELTYSSNALEGNTLNERETALVVEKGLTIAGKTVKEHLEAINHAQALEIIYEYAQKKRADITLQDILTLHHLILKGIDDKHAGTFRKTVVRIAGSKIKLPDPIKIPELMDDFITWLHTTKEHPVTIAADAHYDLVAIHPFVDGNGRTARLVMNLLLIQAGYPPAIIEPKERNQYLDALAHADTSGDKETFRQFIYKAVIASLDIYLDAINRSY